MTSAQIVAAVHSVLGDCISSVVPLPKHVAIYLHFNKRLRFEQIHQLAAEIHHTREILFDTGTGHSHPSIIIELLEGVCETIL